MVWGYFDELFSSSMPSNLTNIINAIDFYLENEMVANFEAPFTAEEVFTSLKQMHSCKAPGLDGMPVLFFTSFWHIVGCDVIRSFLIS